MWNPAAQPGRPAEKLDDCAFPRLIIPTPDGPTGFSRLLFLLGCIYVSGGGVCMCFEAACFVLVFASLFSLGPLSSLHFTCSFGSTFLVLFCSSHFPFSLILLFSSWVVEASCFFVIVSHSWYFRMACEHENKSPINNKDKLFCNGPVNLLVSIGTQSEL